MCDEGNYRTIVIRIDVSIQNARSFDAGDGLRQPRDRFFIAALAEVWYTLDEIADLRLTIDDWLIRRQGGFWKYELMDRKLAIGNWQSLSIANLKHVYRTIHR